MNIIVFSDTKNIQKVFTKIEKAKDYSLEIKPALDYKKIIKKLSRGDCFYIDISSFSETQKKQMLNFCSKQEDFIYGFIDPKGIINSIAELFHDGASDYISKEEYKAGIDVKRLKKAIDFGKLKFSDMADDDLFNKMNEMYILSGNDWKSIKSGTEYSFCFMFIELDNQKKLKKQLGAEHLENFLKTFHEVVYKKITPANGKIWIWSDFGGLILFPFDGVNCDEIIMAFDLMLDSNIINAEYFEEDFLITYRIVLHIGNTLYQKRGDTGDLISDSINSIFHLGQKFADPGSYVITENIYELIPEGLVNSFVDAGKFEGRQIYRVRKLIK